MGSSLNGPEPEVIIYDEAPRPIGVSELRMFYYAWWDKEQIKELTHKQKLFLYYNIGHEDCLADIPTIVPAPSEQPP